MLKRYIGPADRARVSAGGKDLGTVEKGEAIFVPNDLAESVGWPELSWEDVKSENKENN